MANNTLQQILNAEKPFRRKQIEKAWFDVNINGYAEITTLSEALRGKLKNIPWLSVIMKAEQPSKQDDTRKFLFELVDGNCIETILMGRVSKKEISAEDEVRWGTPGDRYTICISSQAGCPMGCVFCATGRGGFKRNLTAQEIIDQVRFCQRLLAKEGARLNNIVVMGQGEPLLNYDNLKRALEIILANTEIGETKITVSTAGVVPAMEKLLTDKSFPKVRWAISLHSALEATRKQIMPSHQSGFLNFLVDWVNKYHETFPSRAHFIGLEYIFLDGINDDAKHLQALLALCRKLKHIRINLIPFNTGVDISLPYIRGEARRGVNHPSLRGITPPPAPPLKGEGKPLARSPQTTIEHWHEELMKAGFTSTIRYSQGQDIAAACGQLANKIK